MIADEPTPAPSPWEALGAIVGIFSTLWEIGSDLWDRIKGTRQALEDHEARIKVLEEHAHVHAPTRKRKGS